MNVALAAIGGLAIGLGVMGLVVLFLFTGKGSE